MTAECRVVLSKCDSGSSTSQCVHAPFVFFAMNKIFHIIALLMKYFCMKETPFYYFCYADDQTGKPGNPEGKMSKVIFAFLNNLLCLDSV